jgi:hypothetical protein
MHSARNGRLLTLSLGAIALAMGVLLACEQYQQVPVIPLHDGRVLVHNGEVVIENASRETDGNAARW